MHVGEVVCKILLQLGVTLQSPSIVVQIMVASKAYPKNMCWESSTTDQKIKERLGWANMPNLPLKEKEKIRKFSDTKHLLPEAE